MKIKHVTINELPINVTGRFYCKFGVFPTIEILESKKDDRGLLEHELTHYKQWQKNRFFHGLKYVFSADYRFACEVEAYKVQAKYYKDDRTPLFARFICGNYNLGVDYNYVLSQLRS